MTRQFHVPLSINTEDNVLVERTQGTLQYDGTVKPFKGQKGITCALASRKLFGFFYGKKADRSMIPEVKKGRAIELILKPIKDLMSGDRIDWKSLFDACTVGLSKLGETPIIEILKNPIFIRKVQRLGLSTHPVDLFQYFFSLPIHEQARMAYATLIESTDKQRGLITSDWSIKDGFIGLQNALRKHGQMIFTGKYGSCFHKKSTMIPFPSENTSTREVYCFKKGEIRNIPFTHCVVVDQAKIINGKPFIFFKDPYNASTPGIPDKVYMLSYETFVSRLSDKHGEVHLDDETTTYGVVQAGL